MVLRHALAALVLLLGACAATTPIAYSDAFDTAGNRLPIACLDLGDVRVSVVLLSHQAMQARLHKDGWSLLGQWRTPRDPKASDGTIYLDRDLEPAIFYDAMRHEMCHAKMFKTRGDPNWHP
jgi:hypothetical protein